jgi:MoaA/NifB/PqqE/SkfB family radical SAM enzyme
VHPRIVDIVRRVKHGGWKPIINTNGLALTPKRLKELKAAGVF